MRQAVYLLFFLNHKEQEHFKIPKAKIILSTVNNHHAIKKTIVPSNKEKQFETYTKGKSKLLVKPEN